MNATPELHAIPTPGFDIPPYHVESFQMGHAVFNKHGFNCTHFQDRPGAKFFTRHEQANGVCAQWNAPAIGARSCIAIASVEGGAQPAKVNAESEAKTPEKTTALPTCDDPATAHAVGRIFSANPAEI